ncbi:MAG: ATP-grasp domain-containing protein [Bacillota bacterium]
MAILSSDNGWHVDRLKTAIYQKGYSVSRVSFEELKAGVNYSSAVSGSHGEKLEDCRYIFVRIIPRGSLEQIFLRMDILHVLEDRGVRVINHPGSIEQTVNKYYTSTVLEKNGLPTPETLATENFQGAMNYFKQKGDVILKPLFGSLGRGMVRLTDEETAYRVFRAWEMNDYVFYLQEFIPHGHSDIRIFICNNTILAHYVRKSNSWKTNIARGGRGGPFEITQQLKDMALKAASLFNLDYCGVDIILRNGKLSNPYIIEINSIPGWSELKKVTDINAGEEIVNSILP